MLISLQQILNACTAIQSIENQEGSRKWAYGISKNKDLLEPHLEKIIPIEKERNLIDTERIRYCEEVSDKDESGNPIVENNHFRGVREDDPKIAEMSEKLTALKDELIKTEVEVGVYMINFNEAPDKITPAIFQKLSFMIREPE